jgi:hypothetical protein
MYVYKSKFLFIFVFHLYAPINIKYIAKDIPALVPDANIDLTVINTTTTNAKIGNSISKISWKSIYVYKLSILKYAINLYIMESEIIVTESPNLKSLSIPSSEPPSMGNKVLGFFSNIGWTKLLVIFAILSFLGVNLFSNLAEVSDWFGKTLGPIFRKVLGLVGITTVKVSEKAVDVTATGAKTGIDIASGTLQSGLGVIEGQLQNVEQSMGAGQGAKQSGGAGQGAMQGTGAKQEQGPLSAALADSLPQIPEPDDATSSTQKNGSGKAGFCYIGEDRGFRSCIKVNEDDKCMSGQIFPSSDICVNPNLRE